MSTTKRRVNHVPKGHYASSALDSYVQRRDSVRNYVPEVLSLLLRVKRIEHADLAAKMGLSVAALRDRLRGRTEISVGEIVAIAELLDVPVSVFLDPKATMGEVLGMKTCLPRPGGVISTTGSAYVKVVPHLASVPHDDTDNLADARCGGIIPCLGSDCDSAI